MERFTILSRITKIKQNNSKKFVYLAVFIFVLIVTLIAIKIPQFFSSDAADRTVLCGFAKDKASCDVLKNRRLPCGWKEYPSGGGSCVATAAYCRPMKLVKGEIKKVGNKTVVTCNYGEQMDCISGSIKNPPTGCRWIDHIGSGTEVFSCDIPYETVSAATCSTFVGRGSTDNCCASSVSFSK